MTDTADEMDQGLRPADAVYEKLNDPAIAASLVTLLDNAELLSTLVLGLSGMMERGDFIVDSLAESVNEVKAAGSPLPAGMSLPSMSDLTAVSQEFAGAAPVLRSILTSPMLNHETVELLGLVSDAASEGAARARSEETQVSALGAVKALRDDDVQRGMGMLIEIARSLGRRLR